MSANEGGAYRVEKLRRVAWDVYFRVNEPGRDYYLHVEPVWEQVPGMYSSHGDGMFNELHVRTR